MIGRVRAVGIRAGREIFQLVSFVRRSPGAAILVALALCLLGHVSSGRQVNEETLTCKLVVTESLSLDASGGKLGAILTSSPTHQTSMHFFDIGKSVGLSVGLFGNGTPGLSIYGDLPNSKTRLALDILPTGPSLRIGNSSSDGAVNLSVSSDGLSQAVLSDARGIRLMLSGRGQNGEAAGISLYNAKETIAAHIQSNDKFAALSLFENHDNKRPVRTLMGVSPGKSPAFFLYDRAIHPLIEMTEDAGGRPFIKVNDFQLRESRTIK